MADNVEKTSQVASPRSGRPGYPGFFSSARTLALPVGTQLREGALGGYYIDFSLKASTAEWPPSWLDPAAHAHVVSAQWGLACFERYVKGEGEIWLAAAIGAANYLLGEQERG